MNQHRLMQIIKLQLEYQMILFFHAKIKHFMINLYRLEEKKGVEIKFLYCKTEDQVNFFLFSALLLF